MPQVPRYIYIFGKYVSHNLTNTWQSLLLTNMKCPVYNMHLKIISCALSVFCTLWYLHAIDYNYMHKTTKTETYIQIEKNL